MSFCCCCLLILETKNYIHAHTRVYTCAYVYTHVCTCIYTYMCTYTHVCAHTCAYMCIYIERDWFVVPLIYVFIDCFLYVFWPQIKPATMSYWMTFHLTNLPGHGPATLCLLTGEFNTFIFKVFLIGTDLLPFSNCVFFY